MFSDVLVADVFGNFREVHELSESFYDILNDSLTIIDNAGDVPGIGTCFADMAEVSRVFLYALFFLFFFNSAVCLPCQNNEFAVFEDLANKYETMLAALLQLCQDQRAWEFLGRQSRDFQNAVRYLLPELLVEPLYHLLHYNEVLELMLKKTSDADVNERANFRSVWSFFFFVLFFC